jgi:hypothetical protein
MAFAMIPSAWAKRKPTMFTAHDAAREAGRGLIVQDVEGSLDKLVYQGLSHFSWRREKSAATAAILILFALTIISNKAQRRAGIRSNNLVAATYESIQQVAPLSRKLIARGLQLLREVEAIRIERAGNASVYALVGIDQPGKWCMLPQQYLCNSFPYMHQLKHYFEHIKRPGSLNALKLYMLLLSLRENASNVARCSYDMIAEYTGLRREDISDAIQLLIATQLIRFAYDSESENRKGDPAHNRYYILGLR